MNIIPYVNRPAPLAWDVAKAIFGATGKALLWEPWDISTMFQDQAGTTPVTAGGDPVRLVLDKRLWGGRSLEKELERQPQQVLNSDFSGGTRIESGLNVPNEWNLYNPSNISSMDVVGGNLVFTAADHLAGVNYSRNKFNPVPYHGADGHPLTHYGWQVRIRARKTAQISGRTALNVYAGSYGWPTVVPEGAEIGQWHEFVSHGIRNNDFIISHFRTDGSGVASASWEIEFVEIKFIEGNHLSQSVLANSFTAVRMPLTGRRNLLTRSEEFANTAWNAAGATNSNYVLDNTAIAPNGTMTASHVIAAPIESTSHGRRSTITGLAELTTYRFSFYAKAAEYSVARAWSFSGGDTSHSLFNLLTGETNGNNSAQMLELADGWWRCSLNVVTVASQTTRVVHFGPSPAFSDSSFTGDGVSGIYVWGAQLELGSIATPYQRVTNANDVHEDGVPDVWGIVSDYSGDVLPATLPFAIDGEILIAGTGGTIIEPVSYASGSTFNLGIDTYTGGTPGILRAIGPIVGVVLLDRAFTDTEKAQLIAYYKGKGAKGLLVEGPELNATGLDGFSLGAGWAVNDGVITRSGQVTGSSITKAIFTSVDTTSRSYLFKVDASARSGDFTVAVSSPGIDQTYLPSGTGALKVVVGATGNRSNMSITGVGSATITASSISVRELRPQEDW